MRPSMTDVALAEAADFYRIDAAGKLDPMMPFQISQFMASLFLETNGDLRVLDAGAGVGSLTAAIEDRICAETAGVRSVEFVCYEIESVDPGFDTGDQHVPLKDRRVEQIGATSAHHVRHCMSPTREP